MQASSKCPNCGLDLGRYVETHCPRCDVKLAPAIPLTAGVLLLNVMIGICGTLFLLASMFVFTRYVNSSSRAKLYEGAPYHATIFRVTSVQYSRREIIGVDGATIPEDPTAFAFGMVEERKEAMDLLPYLNRIPHDQTELMARVPAGTVIPVYLFPTLRGVSRVQLIGAVPTVQTYQNQATWVSSRALPIVEVMGILTALLIFVRFSLLRSRTIVNS